MTTLSSRCFALVAMTAAAGTAFGGPAYQSLKECLAHCIATTDPWTWERAACGADCVADYADSKLSLSTSYEEPTSGLFEYQGQRAVEWRGLQGAQVTVVVNRTPQNLPIQMIQLRLMNAQHPPQSGGLLIGQIPGNQRRNGAFLGTVPTGQIGSGGYLVAEIRYTGQNDVDDVAVIPVFNGMIPPCRADFNGDGFLDFFDMDAFTQAFESGDASADYNHDGFIDFFDVDEFVQDFERGC